MGDNHIDDSRVLVLASSRRELELTSDLLTRSEIRASACASVDELIAGMDEGVGCVVLTDAVLTDPSIPRLLERLESQPTWSELPFVVLVRTESSADNAAAKLGTITQTTVLERPIRARTLASAVRAGLRARTRQFEIRRYLEDLQSAWMDVEAASRAKDEFLAVLAHELRNPLAPIRTAVQFLSLEESVDPDRRKAHAMISRQLQHMVRLVDDLLDVSRVALGRIQVKRDVIILQDVLTDAVDAARPLIEFFEHTLLVQMPEGPIYVDGDLTRLAQVVQNLINNAARYTPTGGTISLRAAADATTATVRVVDTGVGINEDTRKLLFQPFVQASRSVASAQGGLGVGLALARKLVEMHNGTIQVESEGEGRGSEFIVKLPLSFRAPKDQDKPMSKLDQSSASPHVLPQLPQGSRRVLIVDDNVDAAESLSMLLELEGADVKQAHNGYDALSIVKDFQADVVVLDIGMPGLDGYAVCRQLRAMPNGKDMRILALTGWGQQEDRRKTREAGFDAHLVKPVDPEQLTQMLNSFAAARPGYQAQAPAQ